MSGSKETFFFLPNVTLLKIDDKCLFEKLGELKNPPTLTSHGAEKRYTCIARYLPPHRAHAILNLPARVIKLPSSACGNKRVGQKNECAKSQTLISVRQQGGIDTLCVRAPVRAPVRASLRACLRASVCENSHIFFYLQFVQGC